jgi:hypothetical protein
VGKLAECGAMVNTMIILLTTVYQCYQYLIIIRETDLHKFDNLFLNEFFEIEAVNFQKTEIQNKELSSKNIVFIYLSYFLYWKNK